MASAGNSIPPLRVGLLLDSFIQPQWISRVVEDIQTSGFARVCLVIKNTGGDGDKPAPRLKAYWKNRRHLLYAFYSRVDNVRVKPQPDAFETVSIEELVHDAPVLNVTPLRKKYSDWFDDEDARKIEEYKLDVAISFGFRILKGKALQIARHGVWSYHHGDNLINRGGPAGFWEVMEGSPVTGSVLQVLNEDLDNGFVIHRSWSSTSDRFSVKANKNSLFWRSSSFILRALKELHQAGEIVREESHFYRPYYKPLYKAPTNWQLFPKLTKLFFSYWASKLREATTFEQWSIAYRFRSNTEDSNNTFYRFQHVLPPKDRYWADPFPIKVDGKYYLFMEEFSLPQKRGHIVVAELDRSRKVETLNCKVALKTDYHLSYPFVFYWQDRLFMIPETASNSTVELYSCESFPTGWKLETVLMKNIKAKDATVFEANGLWWMFASISGAFSDELHLFYADSPFGPWKPHRQNPLNSDIRNSRPAGKVFEWKGHAYRPAQDCSRYYGYAVTVNRILKLTPDEFQEEEVSKVLPLWKKGVLATHTLNICDDLTVVDYLVRRWK